MFTKEPNISQILCCSFEICFVSCCGFELISEMYSHGSDITFHYYHHNGTIWLIYSQTT